MTDSNADFEAIFEQYRRQHAEQLDAEFLPLQLHVCNMCAAIVLNRDGHHAFHEALRDWTASAGKAFETIADAMTPKDQT